MQIVLLSRLKEIQGRSFVSPPSEGSLATCVAETPLGETLRLLGVVISCKGKKDHYCPSHPPSWQPCSLLGRLHCVSCITLKTTRHPPPAPCWVAVKLQDKRGHVPAALEVTGDQAWEVQRGKESWGVGGEEAFPLSMFCLAFSS